MAPSFYPVHGGAGLRFFRYLPMLHDNNVDVMVICGTPKLKKFTKEDSQSDWVNFPDGQLVSETEIESARILKFKLPGKSAKRRTNILLEQTIACCKNVETKPDVVHVIAPMPFSTIKKLRQLKNLGVKLVYSHTIARKYSCKSLIKKFQKWKVKQVNKQYNCIIVQSLALKDIILETNPEAVTHIIPNGVDTNKFSPVTDGQEKIRLRKKLGLPSNMSLITLVGAVHPRKGTDLLIEAWSQLVEKYHDLHMLLIGPRYDQSREELTNFKDKMERIIQNSQKQANVHFVGQADNVNQYLKATDVFVFPSEREGMPNAVLEAMSTGLPVVLTPFIGLSSEMGNANIEYILAQRSSRALVSSVGSILEDENVRSELSKKARDWIVNNMNVISSVKSHVEVYEALLTQ